ncbi:MAG: hypothetical protein QM771_06960 [Nitrospira sp.]
MPMTGLALPVIAGVVLLSGGLEASTWRDWKPDLETVRDPAGEESLASESPRSDVPGRGRLPAREQRSIGGLAVADVTEAG